MKVWLHFLENIIFEKILDIKRRIKLKNYFVCKKCENLSSSSNYCNLQLFEGKHVSLHLFIECLTLQHWKEKSFKYYFFNFTWIDISQNNFYLSNLWQSLNKCKSNLNVSKNHMIFLCTLFLLKTENILYV